MLHRNNPKRPPSVGTFRAGLAVSLFVIRRTLSAPVADLISSSLMSRGTPVIATKLISGRSTALFCRDSDREIDVLTAVSPRLVHSSIDARLIAPMEVILRD